LSGTEDLILQYANSKKTEGMWEKALQDIFYFIENYVPKRLFDLAKAAPQQIKLLNSVQTGVQYFVIKAPRKGGKTICVAIIVCWLVLRDQTHRAFIISGSKDQAEWLFTYCRDILWPSGAEGAKTRGFFKPFLKREPRISRIEFKRGGWIRYAAASKKQVNAPTADTLVDDEFVLIPTVIVQQAWPMIRGSEYPRRFLLSTATPGEANTEAFLDMLDDAEKYGFLKIEWKPEDCPFLNTDVARKDEEMAELFLSPDMFETQYKGGIPRRAGRVFPRTFIREMFQKPDPNKPGFLMDGSPYDAANLVFQGDSKGGLDWGFEHDTVVTEGYRGLDKKIHVMKMTVGNGTSPSDWANLVEADSLKYGITDWGCDSAGAFQNQELRDRGLRVLPKVFGHIKYGKEWMIGVSYYWMSQKMIVVPDTEEFRPLKNQLLKYKRDADGKPIKGDDDKSDSFICLVSGWDPAYHRIEELKVPEPKPIEERKGWESFESGKDPWMPDEWADRKAELTKSIWG